MANQRRLADNVAHFEAGHAGVPRKGAALLQGIAVCGRCGRRMSLRYSGPNGDYPVYCCRSDRDQQGSALCQEVRALAVDALVERMVLDALMPDQIAIALAAAGQLEQESRQLERQWALRVERAATRPSALGVSMTPSSPRTVLWRARLSGFGKISFVLSRRLSRSMRAGARKSRF
ncbi:hypothetical protein J2R78_008915 [Bradyrhizobium sp. USDA 4538]|uniref:zinc ribbon domain-containing protein n=1 Tax=unclassified Bradyrhizobium TaxID=2631580 RepID=UPI0020A2172B|nr:MULTISPECIES: zinc ribbon domain-containing protein [unclassified Bradyrhizobium]MCP1845881.1 hypothetical protein [Bradyrhizobium sp. USDA 4538]